VLKENEIGRERRRERQRESGKNEREREECKMEERDRIRVIEREIEEMCRMNRSFIHSFIQQSTTA
jgi:hypothetical protein